MIKRFINKKKILIGCSLGLGIVIVIVIIAGFFASRFLIFLPIVKSHSDIPNDLKTSGVLIGSNFLSKKIFFQDTRLDTITDIVIGELDPNPGLEIGIASSNGAVFVNKNSSVKSSVMFSSQASHVDIIDVDNDGVCEFMNRGSWSYDASLIDHKGNIIWTYGEESGVDDMCTGDINRDGISEFVVGFNGGGGVHLLDKNGKLKWKQSDGNVWHVEIVDANGDGNLEIVHSNAGGQIRVRDKHGKIISQRKPAPYISNFSLCKWPSKKSREYALLSENDTIWLFDFDGKVAAQFKAPKCGTLGHARGLPVKIKSNESEYFAVVVEFNIWDKSIIYVYNPAGTLVYQEILPETCASITAISLYKSKTETILVGGAGKILQYEIQHKTLRHKPDTKLSCPKCKSKKNVVPIVYGLLDKEVIKNTEQDKFALGGCVVRSEQWYCKSCDYEW